VFIQYSVLNYYISPFKTQDIIWTGPLTWHTVNLTLIMNYDELNRFTGSLTYRSRRFIFLPWPKGGNMHNAPLNTLLAEPPWYRKVAKPWFYSWCCSALLYSWERHIMPHFSSWGQQSTRCGGLALTKDVQIGRTVLEWYDRHRAY